MNKQPTWNDIHSGTKQELMKTYKLNPRQMEQAVRKQMDGASRNEIEKKYHEFYDKKAK